MYPGELLGRDKPVGGTLSASAPPYVPSNTAAGAVQGPAHSPPIINLAVALAPDLEGAGSGERELHTPESGYGKARWPSVGMGAEETPKMVKRAAKAAPRGAGRGGPVDETPSKAVRAASQLRQLLDFYFEPFNLQHNRYLLDLIARRTPPPATPGPWPSELLADFRFSFDDLMGLGRIAAALAKLKLSQSEALGSLKHLQWTGDGRLQLRTLTEVRTFVAARSASEDVVSKAVRYLAAVREQRGQVPQGMVSVLSYALGEPLNDASVHGAHRQAQLKRQLLLYRTDIMCLAGLDPEGSGAGLTTTLVEEGYSYAWVRSEWGEANAIFWDRSRFILVRHREDGADIAVDLRTWQGEQDDALVLRVICMRPGVPTSESAGTCPLFVDRASDGPLIVCGDFTRLGGAESAVVVEELCGMNSVAREVLGDELQVPLSSPLPQDGRPGPVRAGASGLNRLHCPDGMLYEGVSPLLVLSGHSEHHLATLSCEETIQQFPAFRLPIVAAFQWTAPRTGAMEEC